MGEGRDEGEIVSKIVPLTSILSHKGRGSLELWTVLTVSPSIEIPIHELLLYNPKLKRIGLFAVMVFLNYTAGVSAVIHHVAAPIPAVVCNLV